MMYKEDLGTIVLILIMVLVVVIALAFIHNSHASTTIDDYKPLIIAKNVTKVIDGDTIDIETGDRIRFAIVNTPERGQPGYQEAKQYVIDRCLGKEAIIDVDDNQLKTYGRLVALVYCDVEAYFINLELLEQNLAVVMPQFCKTSEFKDGILCNYNGPQ